MEEPPKKYFRLFPGNEVRLMNAYFVTCTGCVKDENGKVIEVHCTYDPETKCGTGFTGRKVKGTIHWVPAKEAVKAEVRLYENIIDEEKGVSVYDAVMIDDQWRILLPFPPKKEVGFDLYNFIGGTENGHFPMYLVEGDEVGKGSTNEPLLKNVKML